MINRRCRRPYRILVATGLVWALQASLAPLSHAQGLWWRLGQEEEKAFLGGSVHVGTTSMYPLPDAVMEAFARADVLVVEIDILDTSIFSVLGLLFREGIYRDGTTLESHVDPRTWALLQQTLTRFELPELMFRWQKPWFAALNLSMLAFQKAGYREELGVDHHFLQAAAASGKPVVELETVEQQLQLFSRLSAADQEMFLHQTLLELDQGARYLDEIIGAWIASDAEALRQLILQQFEEDSPESRRLHQLFIVERNHAMSRAIQALIGDGLTPFVVVGAGHLVGAQGLVDLLRDAGYRVRPLTASQSSAAEAVSP